MTLSSIPVGAKVKLIHEAFKDDLFEVTNQEWDFGRFQVVRLHLKNVLSDKYFKITTTLIQADLDAGRVEVVEE